MAALDEKKVECLLTWVNLETASSEQPVTSLRQLSSLERIASLLSSLSPASAECDTFEERKRFVRHWIVDRFSAEALDAFALHGDGTLRSSDENLAKMLALILSYALTDPKVNANHVKLVQNEMQKELQFHVMYICHALSNGCQRDWWRVLYHCVEGDSSKDVDHASPAVDAKTSLDESGCDYGSLCNGALTNASTENSPLSPTSGPFGHRCRKFRLSMQRGWGVFRSAKKALAVKDEIIDGLNFERDQLIKDIESKLEMAKNLKAALEEEKTARRQLESALELTKKEVTSLSSLNKDLQSEKESLLKQKSILKDQLESMQDELRVSSSENDKLHQEIAALRRRYVADREKCNKLETAYYTETRAESERIESLEEMVSRLSAEKREALDKADEMEALYETTNAKYKARKSYQKLLAQEIAKLTKYVEALKAQLIDSETRIEEAINIRRHTRQLCELLESSKQKLSGTMLTENEGSRIELSKPSFHNITESPTVRMEEDGRNSLQPQYNNHEPNAKFSESEVQHGRSGHSGVSNTDTPKVQWDVRLATLNERNVKYPLHLKSTYPVETQSIIDENLENEMRDSKGLQTPTIRRAIFEASQQSKSGQSVVRKKLESARKVLQFRLTKATASQPWPAVDTCNKPAVSFDIPNTPKKGKRRLNNKKTIPS